jgi:hypothetical protein
MAKSTSLLGAREKTAIKVRDDKSESMFNTSQKLNTHRRRKCAKETAL